MSCLGCKVKFIFLIIKIVSNSIFNLSLSRRITTASNSVTSDKAIPIISDMNMEDFKVKEVEKIFEDLGIQESEGIKSFNYQLILKS